MKVTIDGIVMPRIKKGITMIDRLDEELDTAVIIAIDQRPIHYSPFSKVAIFVTNDTTADYNYLIDTDICDGLNKDDNKFYRHTVSLIEPVKLLERDIVDNVAFTQPKNETVTRYTMKDVLQRLIDITPLEMTAYHPATRKAVLDTALATSLASIKAPQFNFQRQNLKQAMDEALKYVNAITRVRSYSGGFLKITADYFNKINGVAVKTGYSSYATQNNGDMFAGKFDVDLVNGITNRIDSTSSTPISITFTSEQLVMTTNDVLLSLPKPIYAISKLYMIIKRIYSPLGGSVQNVYQYDEIDITDKIYEEKLFKALPLQKAGEASQYGSLVYSKGGQTIRNFGVAFPQFWGLFTTTTMETIANDNAKFDKTIILPDGAAKPFNLVWYSGLAGDQMLKGLLGFRVEYYPTVSERIRIQKQNPDAKTDNMALATNQSGKSLDISRFIANAQGTLNRLANGDLSLEKSVRLYDDRFKVGQKTADGYIVTTAETQVFDGIFKSRAVFTKNFNRLSQYVSVDREFRQYPIPLEDTVSRNLVYSEYLVASTSELTGVASGWAADMIDYFRYMFMSSYHLHYGTVSSVIATTKNLYGNTIGSFILPITKSSGDNTNILHFGFPDNIAAYYYPEIPSSDNIFEELTTVLMPKRYTYYNAANENDLQNGCFSYMSLTFNKPNLFKNGSDFCIPASNYNDAFAQYDSIKTIYPNGLIFKLATPYMGDHGPWTYIKLSYDTSNTLVNYMLDENAALKDIIYCGYNDETKNDQWKWLGKTSQPAIKHSQDALLMGDYFNSDYVLGSYTDFHVLKEPSEVISMSQHLHYVSLDPAVIYGETFANNSPMMVNRSILDGAFTNLHLYLSADAYFSGENKAKGNIYLNPPFLEPDAFTGFSTSSNTNGFSVFVTPAAIVGYNAWAIGDEAGNLYFAVNKSSSGILADHVYFYFFNKLPTR